MDTRFSENFTFKSMLDHAHRNNVTRSFRPIVATAYKRTTDKVKPVDSSESDGSIPGGDPNWRAKWIAAETYQQEKYSNERSGRPASRFPKL